MPEVPGSRLGSAPALVRLKPDATFGAPPLLLEHLRQVAARVGRVGAELDGTAEFCGRLLEVTLLQRGAAFRDVERRALIAIVCRDEIAPFLEFGCGLVLPPRPRESQPELIPGFAALRLEPRGFLEGRNRVGHLAVPKERLAERQVSPGERRARAG